MRYSKCILIFTFNQGNANNGNNFPWCLDKPTKSFKVESEGRDKPCAACFRGGASSTGCSNATLCLDLVC